MSRPCTASAFSPITSIVQAACGFRRWLIPHFRYRNTSRPRIIVAGEEYDSSAEKPRRLGRREETQHEGRVLNVSRHQRSLNQTDLPPMGRADCEVSTHSLHKSLPNNLRAEVKHLSRPPPLRRGFAFSEQCRDHPSDMRRGEGRQRRRTIPIVRCVGVCWRPRARAAAS
jgi:hypothetical protein